VVSFCLIKRVQFNEPFWNFRCSFRQSYRCLLLFVAFNVEIFPQ